MKGKLVSLSGKKGTGKSSVANYLKTKGYHCLSWAGYMKKALSIMCDWDYETLLADTPETRAARELLPPRQIGTKMYTYREAFTFFGTEVMRGGVSPSIWVDLLLSEIDERLAKGENVVVTDTRLANEITALRERYATFLCLWRSPADLVELPSEHITETAFLWFVSRSLLITVDNTGPFEETCKRVDDTIAEAEYCKNQ